MRRLTGIALVTVLIIAGCAPAASQPAGSSGTSPGTPAGGAPEQWPGVSPEVEARIEKAKVAFLAEFKEEFIYGRALGPSGFQYREKETLRGIPVESLLAGIRAALPGAKPGLELAFWLDLFTIVPSETPGASATRRTRLHSCIWPG